MGTGINLRVKLLWTFSKLACTFEKTLNLAERACQFCKQRSYKLVWNKVARIEQTSHATGICRANNSICKRFLELDDAGNANTISCIAIRAPVS